MPYVNSRFTYLLKQFPGKHSNGTCCLPKRPRNITGVAVNDKYARHAVLSCRMPSRKIALIKRNALRAVAISYHIISSYHMLYYDIRQNADEITNITKYSD